VIEQAQTEFDENLAEIREQAARFRIALVGDTDDLDLLLKVDPIFGFSVGHMLAELGFSIQCLVYSEEPRGLARAPVGFGLGKIEFTPFHTRDELNQLLSAGVDPMPIG